MVQNRRQMMYRVMKHAVRAACYVWVSPATLVGTGFGFLALLTGGGFQLRRGAVEFHGGFIHWAFVRFPRVKPSAMTLGHTILGRTTDDLDRTRDHEHVHVRQYERWGPFFLPAYLLCSVAMWYRGRDPYRDNPFEVEAFELYP